MSRIRATIIRGIEFGAAASLLFSSTALGESPVKASHKIHGDIGPLSKEATAGDIYVVGRQEGFGPDAGDWSQFYCSDDQLAINALTGQPFPPSYSVAVRSNADGSVDLFQATDGTSCDELGAPHETKFAAFQVHDTNPTTSPGFPVKKP